MSLDPSQEAADLAALTPDGEIVIGDERVPVRRFRFLQALRLEQECRALLDDLAGALDAADGEVEPANYGALMDVFARHEGELLRLLEASTGKPAEWIAALDDEHGYNLTLAFWGVNHPFFVRRVLMTLLPGRLAASASPNSMPP